MKNFAFYAKAQPSIGIAKIVFNHLLSCYSNKRFGDVCETTSGGTPNRGNADFYNGDIPWLKSGELTDGLITAYEESITALGLKNSSAKIFPKDTLLVAMYGATAGKTGILNFDAATNQAVCAVFPKERIRRDFVFWYLKQQRVDFIEISRGGAQPNISQTVIKNAIIPCPSIEVQDMVIAFLDKVDAGGSYQIPVRLHAISREVDNLLLIRSRFEAANAELNSQTSYLTQLRQALLREAMQGQLLPRDPTDEPATLLLKKLQSVKAATGKVGKHKAGALFAEDVDAIEGPFEIPANWAWCKTKQISELITSGSRDWAKYYSATGAKFVRMGNLSRGSFQLRLDKMQYVKAPKSGEGNRTKLEAGDILISVTGEVGNLGLIPSGFGEAYINQHTALVRLNPQIDFLFIAYCFLSPELQAQFNAPQRGMKNSFRLSDVDELLIPLPPVAEQRRIVAKLEELMQHCDALEQRIRESRRLAEQMLQTALREALAPPAGTEPAEEAELEMAEADAAPASARRGRLRQPKFSLDNPPPGLFDF